MLLKKRSKPPLIDKLEALIPRLPPTFSKMPTLEEALSKEWKGYLGERKVDFYLETLDQQYAILQDVYLKISGRGVQIDHLIITPHAAYIIESKNFNGTLIFDTTLNQFTREDRETISGYLHPISQVQLQASRISHWFEKQHISSIPIYYFVAIADPNTIIKVDGDKQYISSIVSHASNIPGKIIEKENILKEKTIVKLQHHQIAKMILSQCQKRNVDVLKKYSIKAADIFPGVRCPVCGHLGMTWYYGKWHCRKCGSNSKIAHLKALNDYFLLISDSITNSEAQKFLGIESRSVITRIFRASNMICEHKRWRKK